MTATRNAPYARALRAQYRQHLIKVDGVDYNPALDDVLDERNPRGWSHGTIEGYRSARCKCPPCAKAGKKAAEQDADVRIANRLALHRARLQVLLTQRLNRLNADTAARIAEHVVENHEVADRYRARFRYDPIAVRRDLRRSGARVVLRLDDDALTDLVEAVLVELAR